MADDHWGLRGEPPSEVQVIVSGPQISPLRALIAAASTWPRLRLLVSAATVAAAAVVVLTLVIGGGAISSPARLGGPLRCLRSSPPCMTRALTPRP